MSQVSRLEDNRNTRQEDDEKGEIARKTEAEMVSEFFATYSFLLV